MKRSFKLEWLLCARWCPKHWKWFRSSVLCRQTCKQITSEQCFMHIKEFRWKYLVAGMWWEKHHRSDMWSELGIKLVDKEGKDIPMWGNRICKIQGTKHGREWWLSCCEGMIRLEDGKIVRGRPQRTFCALPRNLHFFWGHREPSP